MIKRLALVVTVLATLIGIEETMAEPLSGEIYMVTIHTDNYARMRAFFADSMGMEVVNEQGEFVEFRSDGLRLSLASFDTLSSFLDAESLRAKRAGSGLGIGFHYDTPEQVDTVTAELKKAGVAFVAEPTAMPWGEYTAFFSDPDGNVHELVAEMK